MSISSSYKAAGLIILLVVTYFGVRTLANSDESDAEITVDSNSDGTEFTVLATQISSSPWQEIVNVRGRTKAFRKVIVRSETAGIVAATPTAIGADVSEGAILCRLKVDARQSQVNQARAALAKARIDYNAASELMKEGLGSANALASAKAALDLADASLLQSNLTLEHTKITAPFTLAASSYNNLHFL